MQYFPRVDEEQMETDADHSFPRADNEAETVTAIGNNAESSEINSVSVRSQDHEKQIAQTKIPLMSSNSK